MKFSQKENFKILSNTPLMYTFYHTCVPFTFNWPTLTSEMHFVRFHLKIHMGFVKIDGLSFEIKKNNSSWPERRERNHRKRVWFLLSLHHTQVHRIHFSLSYKKYPFYVFLCTNILSPSIQVSRSVFRGWLWGPYKFWKIWLNQPIFWQFKPFSPFTLTPNTLRSPKKQF